MVKHFRLKKLINWTIQGPIVTRLVMHILYYNIATLFLLMVVYGIKSSLAVIADRPIVPEPLTFWQQAVPVVICMMVMMPFMIWDLIKLTNRIAGPLFRFECLLNEFGKSGKLNAAVLRDGDLLTDYQQQFNNFVESLHARFPETSPISATPASLANEPETATVAFRKSV